MTDDHERMIRAELVEWPGTSVSFAHRAKHREATFTYQSASRFIIFPSTTSDSRRAARNSIRDMRKELTALGAERAHRAAPAPRRDKPHHKPREREITGIWWDEASDFPADQRLDWREALAAITFPRAFHPRLWRWLATTSINPEPLE